MALGSLMLPPLEVFVVTAEPYHDNGLPMGAFASIEDAKAAFPAEWDDDGWYVNNEWWPNVVSCAKWDGHRNAEVLLIYRLEVQ